MIQKVTLTTIYCTDQQAARDFYVDVLGLDVRADATSDGVRWILVGPKDQPDLSLMLTLIGPPLTATSADALRQAVEGGGLSTVTFAVDDCEATIDDLRAKGVEILHEPTTHPLGFEAVARDSSGNTLVFIQYTNRS